MRSAVAARGMLQVFQMNVTKVDQNVAYVAMVVYICCKGMLPLFHLFFPNACCNCVYYLDVACVLYECCIWLQWFSSVFRCFLVFSVSSAFRSMLQRLYLDVSKINWVLHLSSSPFAASSRYRRRRPLPLSSLGRRRPTWRA
jgi:hypothetical protein